MLKTFATVGTAITKQIGKAERYTAKLKSQEYGKIIEFLIVNGRAGDTPDLKKLGTEESDGNLYS